MTSLISPPRVTIGDEIGRGAFSNVHRCRRDGKEYAIKLPRPDITTAADTAFALRREAAALATLHHPGLVEIHELGEVGDQPYLVMELIQAPTLDAVLEAKVRLSLDEILKIGIEVGGALGAAHGAGLVHRDVKPQNIALPPSGDHTKLFDFGLVGLVGEQTPMTGTLLYSPPEKTGMLKRPFDGRSDLYSLGVILFECATGAPPFDASDPGELMRLHAQALPPAMGGLRPELPPALSEITAKLMAKDPDDRYQSAVSMVADLERVAAGEVEFAVGETQVDARESVALVGREADIDVLREAWARARRSQGNVVLVVGEPGVGKSRLVREALVQIREEGALTMKGKCSPANPVPLAAVREAIESGLAHLRHDDRKGWDERQIRLRARIRPYASLLRGLSRTLDTLVGGTPDAVNSTAEQHSDAVAELFVDLAWESGGAVLHVDDVQWLDPGGARVLKALSDRLAKTPLLVVCTARTDAASAAQVERFGATVARAKTRTLTLRGLPDVGTADLVRALFGGAGVEAEFVRQIVTRTDGNPFAVIEYVRAVIDAGLLRPSWGSCLVDREGLDCLELPSDVIDLVTARLGRLAESVQPLLGAAAVMGVRFRPSIVAAACGAGVEEIATALGGVIRLRLIEAIDGDEHMFVHDRVREAALLTIPEGDLPQVHQRLAEALDRRPNPDPETVYAIARHHGAGTWTDLRRIYETNARAGRLALRQNALQDALDFFEAAAAAADAAGILPDGAFIQAHGLALSRIGRFEEARDRLKTALDLLTDPLRRAQIQRDLASTHYSQTDFAGSLEAAMKGMGELGRRPPKNPILAAALTVVVFAGGLLCGWTGIGRGTARGVRRERLQIFAALCDLAGRSSFSLQATSSSLFTVLRLPYLTNRLGMSAETARFYATLGMIAGALRMPRRSERIFQRILAISDQLSPTMRAGIRFDHGTAMAFGDTARAARLLQGALMEDGQFLSLGDRDIAMLMMTNGRHRQGYDRDTVTTYEVLQSRRPSDVEARADVLPCFSAQGRTVEQLELVTVMQEALGDARTEPPARGRIGSLLTQVYLELGELGQPFEAAAALVDDATMISVRISGCLARAYARVDQCRTASPEDLRGGLKTAWESVVQLDRAIGDSRFGLRSMSKPAVSEAHFRLLQASLHQLSGEAGRARGLLDRAERAAVTGDAPWVRFEVERVRARLFMGDGLQKEATLRAGVALLIATEQGWKRRARAVREEFGLENDLISNSGRLPLAGPSPADSFQEKRQLGALLQLNAAAAKELDPQRVVRIALDEIVGILGAERAALFLCEESDLAPTLYCGRDLTGADIDAFTGYASTVVERARLDRRAIVVTGSEEGEALGSRSAVMHDLRSIMAAPLEFEGRLFGILYLDSTVAKGFFSHDDLDILVALSSTIATSLQTARAAQLEIAVQVERGQLVLAEAARAEAESAREEATAAREELKVANAELERASLRKSQFLASMSHEFRTPLSAIIGFSDLLLDGVDGALNEEQHKDVTQVNLSGKALLELINEILDLSKIEAGKMRFEIEPVAMDQIIEDVMGALRPLVEAKSIRFRSEIAPGELNAACDPLRTRQVIINLVSNALKFTSEGGITLHCERREHGVEVSVIDTGIGIPTEAQAKVFEEYGQAEDGGTTRKFGGTGLGLSISHKMIEFQGGRMGLESKVGKGSRFWFILPVAELDGW